MKQLTLAVAKGFKVHGRATRKAEFLARMEVEEGRIMDRLRTTEYRGKVRKE